MAYAFVHGFWMKRALALGFGLPLIAGLFAAVDGPSARAVDGPKTTAKAAPTAPPAGNSAEVIKIIDDKLEAGWKENKLTPSKPADDYEFIRRVSLDIVGRVATPAEIDAYIKDPKDRRANLIERLLKNEEYPKNWANIWSNWLLTRSGPFSRNNYHEALNVWLEDQFAQNIPYNKMVEALVTAKGKNIGKDKDANAATNFILAHLGEPIAPKGANDKDYHDEGHFTMIPVTSRITRLFLGVQTQCTQCHDHPFDAKLRQRDFWGVNAFLRQIERKGTPPNMRQMNGPGLTLELLDNENINTDGLVTYEKRNGVFMVSKPVFLGGSSIDPAKVKNRREELASLLVEHENFPKAIVNRMWAHFFGKGLSNPVDDFTEQSQCAYPELLDELGKQYKHYGYNQKDLIRWICNSKAYQLSCVANKTNDKPDAEPLFSRMLLKSMSPEQLFESLWVSTKMEDAVGATGKKDFKDKWQASLITNFGDDEGNEVSFNGTVVQALMMMNGKEINDAINNADKGTVAQIMKKKGTPDSVINELYMASLNRPATAKEIAKIKTVFKESRVKDASLPPQLQDLFWALLNSNEFLLNH